MPFIHSIQTGRALQIHGNALSAVNEIVQTKGIRNLGNNTDYGDRADTL